MIDMETLHYLTLHALNMGLAGRRFRLDNEKAHKLGQTICGVHFPNPLGLAAGYDKYALAVPAYERIGFGFAEIGSVTPLPQKGNPRPRMHRLSADRAMINHMGLNNPGYDVLFSRIEESQEEIQQMPIIVNLAKGRDQTDPSADYVQGVKASADKADLVVINLSCPNVTGFKNLQAVSEATPILKAVQAVRQGQGLKTPVFIKIGPDLDEKNLEDLIGVAMETGVNGVVATNLTHHRPDTLKTRPLPEKGGLSGPPMKDLATATIRAVYHYSKGALPIIGVGGVSTAEDAYEKIRAGAALIEIYTALVYHGFGRVGEILTGLAALLQKDGFANIAEAVGAEHKQIIQKKAAFG